MAFGEDIASGGVPVWGDDPMDLVVINQAGVPSSVLTGEEAVWIGEGGSRELVIIGGGGGGGGGLVIDGGPLPGH